MTDSQEVDKRNLLDVDTLDALRGTENVRDRLLLEMSTGTPAVADLAYAVKIRIKEDYKIAEKVMRKRMREQRPDYSVAHLRDVVGLRIVTLYRLDALRIIPALLHKIQEGFKDPHSVFSGEVDEVVIYSTNPQGDAQGLSSRLVDVFDAHRLKEKTTVAGTPSNYTSIHMVTWCRGKYREGYRRIPAEIQVRTALEDVWSEIDHSLKYKRDAAERDGPGIDRSEEGRLQTSLAHLNVMKTLVDGIAQYADQIKIQLDEVDAPHRLSAVLSRPAEDAVARLAAFKDLPPAVLSAVKAAIDAARPPLQAGPSAGMRDNERLAALRGVLDELTSIAGTMGGIGGLSEAAREELDYVVNMERALVMLAIGDGLDGAAGLLAEAGRIYSSFESKYPDRLIVRYRRAKVLDALGDRLTALAKLREMLAELERRDGLLPPGHWLRSAARRVLGTLLWEEGDALDHGPAADRGDRRSERLALFLDAYKVTRPAYDLRIDAESYAAAPTPSERSKVANNLLWFAVEYLRAGGSATELEPHGFGSGDVARLLGEMEAAEPSRLGDPRHLDTALEAYEFIGDKDRSRQAAERLLQLLGAEGVVDRGAGSHDEAMLRRAQAVIGRETTAPEGQPAG